MKKLLSLSICALLLCTFLGSCGNDENRKAENTDSTATAPNLKAEAVSYADDTTQLQGFAAYDANKKNSPVILIVHEWWGLNDYVKNRAQQLAELGYFAFAVDMYGEGKKGNDPNEAGALASPFYQDPSLAEARIKAAWEKIKTYEQADTDNAVAIGYCFGGSMVLTAAKAGFPFKGVVSFHGGLAGMAPEKDKIKAEILVCHGGADQFVPEAEVNKFKTQMDSVGAQYTFKVYEGATHAFTNPDATENGKKFNIPIAYNEKADKDSWKDFMDFLDKVLKK